MPTDLTVHTPPFSIAPGIFCREHRVSFAFVSTMCSNPNNVFEAHQRRLWRCPKCWEARADQRSGETYRRIMRGG